MSEGRRNEKMLVRQERRLVEVVRGVRLVGVSLESRTEKACWMCALHLCENKSGVKKEVEINRWV